MTHTAAHLANTGHAMLLVPVKPQLTIGTKCPHCRSLVEDVIPIEPSRNRHCPTCGAVYSSFGLPPHAPGDVIAVREEWRLDGVGLSLPEDTYHAYVAYRAGEVATKPLAGGEYLEANRILDATEYDDSFQPASTMPDWAVRTWARVVEVLPPVQLGDLTSPMMEAMGFGRVQQIYATYGEDLDVWLWRIELTAAEAAQPKEE